MGTPPNNALRTALRRAGWRPETFARRLNTAALAAGLDDRLHVKTPYKWLAGAYPRSPWRALSAAVLAEHLGSPVTVGDLGWPDDDAIAFVPSDHGLALPWNAAGTLAALRQVCDAGAVDRRHFLAVTGAALTAPTHGWLIVPAADRAGRAYGAPIDDAVVDHLDEIANQFRQMDDRLGGGSLITLVEAQVRYVSGLLDHRRYTDTVGRRLHATVAELLRLAGFVAFDAGRHARGQRLFLAGLHAAHTAGDRALGANILGFMSCQAKDLDRVGEAVTLAETARAGYPGASPRVAAILDLRAAEAYANAGTTEARPCQAAIDSAFARLGKQAPQHGEPAWCYWMDSAQANAQAGYCHLKLKNWKTARSHLRAALRTQNAAHGREGALRQTLLATAYARDGEPERGCAAGDKAIDLLGGQVDSARCLGHLTRLRATLTPYRANATVRDFMERSQPLVAAATR